MSRINDMTLLNRDDLYLIEGHQYKYHTSENKGHSHTYWFNPVPGGKRKATLKLSRSQVMKKVEKIDA
ncbi:hypothetical protein NIES4074_36360 [Cylindrospermum sp. NIES-4074]|nr:hypothetical protein NIES4074_36360 [Cylindrospermum sp. NIES-4074]